jgi:hypothetical protein
VVNPIFVTTIESMIPAVKGFRPVLTPCLIFVLLLTLLFTYKPQDDKCLKVGFSLDREVGPRFEMQEMFAQGLDVSFSIDVESTSWTGRLVHRCADIANKPKCW